MALVLQDRVEESSTSVGTSTFTLNGAVPGYRTFASCIPNGSVVYYAIVNNTVIGEWEVGYGTFTTPDQLSRTNVYSSSNANALVNFSAGDKIVFITQPADKAIYEQVNGETLIDGGPITVVGSNVTAIPALSAELAKFVGNVNLFAQVYALNQNDGVDASADFVTYNDQTTDGNSFFTDMGLNSSNYNSATYPIFTPNSGYLISYGDGGSNTSTLFVGSGDSNVSVFAGGFDSNNIVAEFKSDLSTELKGDLTVLGTSNVSGAATFGSTVTLNQSPALPLEAATKQYVDQVASAGLHIHDPVLVETTGNLTATYAQGGTTFNITDITNNNTVTTSTTHSLAVNDQIWLTSTAGNNLSANTAYFVYSIPASNQLTLSLTFGGVEITNLTNASGLTYPVRANSGVGATLTNSGANVALTVDGVSLANTNRVMVRLQTNQAENGVYVVTNPGAPDSPGPGAAWVLTRATDANKVNPGDPDGLGTGDYFYTESGTVNAGDSHVLTTEPNTMIIGYTPLTYTLFTQSPDFVGGTNIDITGQTISLTGTVAATNGGTGSNTVATGDLLYGSATNTWSKLPAGAQYKSLVMGASVPEWNAVALNQSGAVSGSLPATNGGTGQNSYAVGDLLYSGATNSLAKLPGNTTTTKKYLQQQGDGANSAAPSWQQIASSDITGLGTIASQNANNVTITGGSLDNVVIGANTANTGNFTTVTATTVNATTGNFTNITANASGLTDINASNITSGTISNARTTGSTSNSASTIVLRDASGNFGSNVISASLFSGDGSGINAINASNISSGTIANTRTTAASANGASTIVLRDSGGNFEANTINAVSLIGNAAQVTAINASAITTGTLANARTTASSANGASTIVLRDANGSFNSNVGSFNVGSFADGSNTAPSISFTNSTGTGLFLPAANTIAFTEGGVESMRIDSSGNVGIGTSSPSQPVELVKNQDASTWFHVSNNNAGTGAAVGYLMTNNTGVLGALQLNSSTNTTSGAGNAVVLRTLSTNPLVFGTNSTERVRIDSSGNVGIGTSSPSALLSVNGRVTLGDQASSGTAGAGSFIVGGGAFYVQASQNTTSGSSRIPIIFSNIGGSAESMRIDSSGNVGIGTSSPGVRLEVSGTIRSTSATIADAATITPTAGTTNQYTVTALAQAATIAAPSGTPIDGQKLTIRLKDNGVARALTWTTSSGAYRAVGVTLPTTTSAGKVTYVGCIYNSQDTFWDVIAVTTQA